MTCQFLCAVLLMLTTVMQTYGQPPTKLVQVCVKPNEYEFYSVLMADEAVQQGSFVRYREELRLSDEIAVLVTGRYEAGTKVGEWRTYWPGRPFNRLQSSGSYRTGQRDGQWTYYSSPKKGEANWKIPVGKSISQQVLFEVQDTIALVQARGQYRAGSKVGTWKYYDRQKKLVQAVSEPGRRLTYWERRGAAPASGEEVANNHPLLYLGGDNELRIALQELFLPWQVMEVNLKIGKMNTAVIAIAVDSLGNKTGTSLTTVAPQSPGAFEKFVLEKMAFLPGSWLPKTVNGVPTAASYRVVIEISLSEKFTGYESRVNLLGE